jgi:hypothetical protein
MFLLAGEFDNLWRTVNGKLLGAEELAAGKPTPSVKTAGPLTESDIPEDALNR